MSQSTTGQIDPRVPAALVSASLQPGEALIGGRYQLLNELGRGGMGVVYRALDRLTGRVVTLKRLNVGAGVTVEERLSPSGYRLALAEEFRLLASLHHPNIVGVLDYGFDAERHPFFSMDLQESAQTIVEAGRGQPLVVQAELLVNLLRALVYLHRHGIIHRDLKPENVLVVGDRVKVLDFGLAAYRDLLGGEAARWAGTFTYLAPEILGGAPPSESSDLYAFGVIALEVLTGRHTSWEWARERLTTRHAAAATMRHDGADEIDARVRPIVTRLLEHDPARRYRDATEVIEALAAALGQPFTAETIATRESLLQAAPFVGRDRELAELKPLLDAALAGRGGAWLVGGESGVGKSRLLEELRTRALVSGLTVVRGQAISDGGSPYHLWRDVISALVLPCTLTDLQAGVLKAIVPDIERLLGRPVADPPPVDPTAAQSRRMLHVEELFRLQRSPVLALLEDVHWAGSESLQVLAALARLAAELPLSVVATFRSEEAPTLPAAVECPNVLILNRLDSRAIADLGRLMIGAAGARPEVAAYLERESEGIPLFIVEVVRALAEGAGTLTDIDPTVLADRPLAGGVRKVLQRRLSRVPPDAVSALRSAAVIGRETDPRLLRVLHADLDLDAWIARCAEAAVLEAAPPSWRFAHDKLRERILEDLSANERGALHRRVAEAIEATYPDDSDRYAVLAHHWRLAGIADRERHYAELSASQALASGAYAEAIERFQRALELFPESSATQAGGSLHSARRESPWRRLIDPLARVPGDDARLRRGALEAGLTEAHYRLGDLAGCERHAARALQLFGLPMPRSGLGWVAQTTGDVVARCAQRLWPGAGSATPRSEMAAEILRVQSRLTEVYFYSLRALPVVWSTLRHLNMAEPTGPSPELSRAYVHMAVVAGVVPLRRSARYWAQHATDIAERTGTARDVAYALTRAAALELSLCRWQDADEHITRADAIAAEIGDLRLCEEARTEAGILALYHGPLARGLAPLRSAYELSRRSGSKQGACWSLAGQADLLLRLGRPAEALPLYEDAVQRLDERAMLSEAIWAYGGLALTHLRLRQEERAREFADRALRCIEHRTPVAYWTQQGTAATAEVLLSLLERRPEDDTGRQALVGRATAACTGLQKYARRFPLGQAHSQLWGGLLAWLTGRPRNAMTHWRQAIAVARALETPYELARAHFEIGRWLPVGHAERRVHLDRAAAMLAELDCAQDLARVRELA